MSWTTFSRKSLHSLRKHASHRALNLKCQPCCQRALTTKDAPGIVQLLFTRSYFKMSKGFCMSYEHDRLLKQQASTTGGLELSKRHPFTHAHLLPTQPSAWHFPQTLRFGRKACLFTPTNRLAANSPSQTAWLSQKPNPPTKVRGLQRKIPLCTRKRGASVGQACRHSPGTEQPQPD